MKEAMNDSVLEEDIKSFSNIDYIDYEKFRNKSFFITGATGLIGSQLVKVLSYLNRTKKLNIKLVLLIRDTGNLNKIYGDLLDEDYFIIRKGDILSNIQVNEKIDYIIHAACPTSSKYFVNYPIETIDSIVNGTKNMLELAKSKKIESFIYLSSLEVYGNPLKSENIAENDYGYIDNLNIRSSYSEGKRMAECLCIAYNKEYNVPVKIARLSQTFGPGVDYNDGRVFAEFVRCAIEKKDIVLHTEGNTLRTYCYTKDAIEALLFLLISGVNGEAYNITNPDTAITIKDMAKLVCNTFKESNIATRIEKSEDINSFGYNPEMIIKIDPTKINNLGWKATTGLKEMFIRMKKSIADREKYRY